jgi:hypothetical protein
VSSSPDGTLVQVVRANGTDIEGDLLSAEVGAGGSFEDVFTDQAIGTVNDDCEQIAVAHRSVTDDDEYQCHVFWSDDQIVFPTTGSGRTKHNWVDTGGSIGTESVLVEALGVASRAFDHDGSVYVNLVFAGVSDMGFGSGVAYGHPAAVQNTYFLYRDDGFLCAKAAANRAGGFAPSVGHLPAVIETEDNTYTWVGTERRIVPFGGKHDGYADRGPRDITFAFDSDEARRCVRLGQTLYVTGGEILQYDGTRLTEVGFHTFPYYFSAFEDLEEGDLGEGTYYYKITYRWDNGRGELDRSTTATHGGVAIVSPPGSVVLSTISPLHVTHKTDSPPAIEIWRTLVNPGDDAPYYLVTSKDPTDLTGDNRYIANDTTIGLVPDFDDLLVDDDARELESSPENGGVLENLAPPAATIIAAGDTRLFLAGVAGDPHRIWYSKQRPDGEVAAFHEALTVPVPSDGGEITALAFLNETLIAFRESSIYALAGDGFDNFGAGSNYGPARSLSFDIGAVNHESLATTDRGIVFKSRKGWYLLNRGWSLEYIGGQVSDYDDETPLAVNSLESQHQIRIVTASRVLVLDTLVGQWSEWSIDDGLDATIWQGTYAYLTDAGPKIEQATHTDLTYGFDIETAWIKLADLQGYKRIRALAVLGEYRSAFRLRIRLARDYRTGYFDDSNWTPSPVEVGGPMQVRIGPSIQQVEAIKIRLTATSVTEEAASITFESGGSTLVVSALVPGPDGNLIDLANDGGAGESPPSIVEAVDPESDRWVITMSSEETSTFDLVAAALNTSALVSAAVVGEGSTTFPISSIFSGSLEGGTVVESAPSGEAAKLTGIGFEFGLKRGLFRHLPSAQKR